MIADNLLAYQIFRAGQYLRRSRRTHACQIGIEQTVQHFLSEIAPTVYKVETYKLAFFPDLQFQLSLLSIPERLIHEIFQQETKQDFITRHPSQRRAYFRLLDLLIDNGRCEEARAYLAKADRLETSYRSDLYLGMILEKEGKPEEASACWERMTQKDPDNWQSWFARADRLAKRCAYPEAIALYEKALELAPRPRFTDPFNAIAQLYEIQGQYEKAIEFYQKEIELVREDWNETQGEAIDEPLRNIARLKEKMIE